MSTLEALDRMILLARDYASTALSDEDICTSFQSRSVLCVSDLQNLSSHSGQTALVTLVMLLSRMGFQVALDIPEVPMLSQQPPLYGAELKQALLNASELLVPGATIHADTVLNPDVVFLLGDTHFRAQDISCWRL